MKKILLWLTIISSLVGCGQRMVSEELVEADSLLAMEKNDSAYQLLSGIKERYLVNDEDRVHYYLLMTRAAILTDNDTPPDSCIDYAISFYEQRKDSKSLADAYYYKAYKVFSQQNYTDAMHLLKMAEVEAANSHEVKQQIKVAELIATINEIRGNYVLQQKYALETLRYAEELGDSIYLAYSYRQLSHNYACLSNEDSARYYALKIIPCLGYVYQEDIPVFLTVIGSAYINADPEKAKKYFLESIEKKEMTSSLAFLADIYNDEGNRDEAYRLWKKAMTINDEVAKDVIIYNILEYDVQHGNTDNVLDKVNEIMDIKDSIQRKLACDTLKDLQLRFDHEVEKHELDRQLDRSIIAIIALIVLVVALSLYILIKRYRHRLLWTQTQIQIDNCNAQIRQLKEAGEDAKQDVTELMARIEALKNSNSMRLNRGLILYNELMDNASIGKWSKEDYDGFVDYYDAIDHPTVKRHKKEYKNLTPRSLTYLLLKDMGKSDDTVREIMGLSPEGLRSMRFRMKHS